MNDRTITAAISGGARTIVDLIESCEAGSRCRGCWPELRRLLESHCEPADLASV